MSHRTALTAVRGPCSHRRHTHLWYAYPTAELTRGECSRMSMTTDHSRPVGGRPEVMGGPVGPRAASAWARAMFSLPSTPACLLPDSVLPLEGSPGWAQVPRMDTPWATWADSTPPHPWSEM